MGPQLRDTTGRALPNQGEGRGKPYSLTGLPLLWVLKRLGEGRGWKAGTFVGRLLPAGSPLLPKDRAGQKAGC